MTLTLKNIASSLVLAKNYRQASPWLSGAIFNKRSSTLFLVQLADDSELRCHPDQLQHRSPNLPDVSETCGGNADNILTWPNISTSEESVPHSSISSERTVPRHSNGTRHPPNRYLPDT